MMSDKHKFSNFIIGQVVFPFHLIVFFSFLISLWFSSLIVSDSFISGNQIIFKPTAFSSFDQTVIQGTVAILLVSAPLLIVLEIGGYRNKTNLVSLHQSLISCSLLLAGLASYIVLIIGVMEVMMGSLTVLKATNLGSTLLASLLVTLFIKRRIS